MEESDRDLLDQIVYELEDQYWDTGPVTLLRNIAAGNDYCMAPIVLINSNTKVFT